MSVLRDIAFVIESDKIAFPLTGIARERAFAGEVKVNKVIISVIFWQVDEAVEADWIGSAGRTGIFYEVGVYPVCTDFDHRMTGSFSAQLFHDEVVFLSRIFLLV